jgi:hypothetical protein
MKLPIICTACGEPCPHLKGLIDHYEKYHPELLKRYSIRHHPSKNSVTMKAPDAKTILDWQGWNEKDCKIEVL